MVVHASEFFCDRRVDAAGQNERCLIVSVTPSQHDDQVAEVAFILTRQFSVDGVIDSLMPDEAAHGNYSLGL